MTRSRRLTLSLLLNVLLSVGLVFAANAAHSTGLLADAGHNLTDAMAILLALVASTMALRPATERRSFGFERSTILAALANGIVLVLVTVGIVWLAITRLLHPLSVHGSVVVIAASASLVINLFVVGLLREGSRDLGIRSALIHSLGDALSAGVVAVAGIITMVAHGPVAVRIDPIASLVVAAFIVVEAVRITGTSLQVLLEGVPADIDLVSVRTCICGIDGIAQVHDLHVWSLSSERRALSAHLLLDTDPKLSDTASIVKNVRRELEERFLISHATIELESSPCAETPPHA